MDANLSLPPSLPFVPPHPRTRSDALFLGCPHYEGGGAGKFRSWRRRRRNIRVWYVRVWGAFKLHATTAIIAAVRQVGWVVVVEG